MKRIAWGLLLAAGCAGAEPAARPAPVQAPPKAAAPAAVTTDGVPAVPEHITRRLAQYQSARSAAFEDFAGGGSVLIATRFAAPVQLHLVPFPGGRREQITFSDEPVSGGMFVPGTAEILYSQARGGDENY